MICYKTTLYFLLMSPSQWIETLFAFQNGHFLMFCFLWLILKQIIHKSYVLVHFVMPEYYCCCHVNKSFKEEQVQSVFISRKVWYPQNCKYAKLLLRCAVCEWPVAVSVAQSAWLLKGCWFECCFLHWNVMEGWWMGIGVDDRLAPNRQQITFRINTDQTLSTCVCLKYHEYINNDSFMSVKMQLCYGNADCYFSRDKMDILGSIFSKAVVHIMACVQQTSGA